MTISDDDTCAIWEATTQKQICNIPQAVRPTALEVSVDGKAAFVGSELGAYRIYDVSNRSIPRIVKQFRFFEDTLPITAIKASPDGKVVIIYSTQSNKIFISSQKSSEEFDIFGFVETCANIHTADFCMEKNEMKVAAVTQNDILTVMKIPLTKQEDRLNPWPEEKTCPLYKKVDRGTNFALISPYIQNLFIVSSSKFIQGYDTWPADKLEKINWKQAPLPPTYEYESHDLGTTCADYCMDLNTCCSGGKDGALILRPLSHTEFGDSRKIVAHSILSGGVFAIHHSRTREILYSTGGDGSIMIWATSPGETYPKQAQAAPDVGTAEIAKLREMEFTTFDNLRLFKDLMLEAFHKANESKKDRWHKDIMLELNVIRSKLIGLLNENKTVTDIEKL